MKDHQKISRRRFAKIFDIDPYQAKKELTIQLSLTWNKGVMVYYNSTNIWRLNYIKLYLLLYKANVSKSYIVSCQPESRTTKN